MKKQILSALCALATLAATAQIKVYSGGKAAFGSTSSTPNYNIDVKAGDVNVNDGVSSNGYRLGQSLVLHSHNVGTCIFVGPGSGAANTAKRNTAMGYNALNTVSSNTATPNTAFGCGALRVNTGYFNDAFGDSVLTANTTGVGNLAVGAWSLTNNTTGPNNIAIGGRSMEKNTTGGDNTALGWTALFTNTTGNNNTANGFQALYNYNGNGNTGMGYKALYGATSGSANTALGYQAGLTVTTGSLSTFVGYGADASAATYTNCAAFGYGTVVTATNKIFFGNSSVLGCYNAANVWAAQSDSRFKTNVKEDVKGLEFIKKLRPVTYNMDTKKLTEFTTQNMSDSVKKAHVDNIDFTESTNRIHSGFIAQEVEQAMQQTGFTSNTIVFPPSNSTDPYSLNYVELVVPLVKAVQQLSLTLDSLKQRLNACCPQSTGQRGTNNTVPNGVNINPTIGGDAAGTQAKLWQNTPNPFNQTTVIKCFIPDQSRIASILIFDLTGALKKTVPVSGKGEVNVTLYAKELVAGMYNYSLIIDGQEIDTKKMILTE